MVSVNATFFVQLLQFIILVFILNYLLFRPLMRLVRDRDLKIERTKQEILEIQGKIKLLLERKAEQEAQAIREANMTRSEMKEAAVKEALEFQEKVKSEILLKRASLEQEVQKAIERELMEIEALSKNLAKEILARLTLRSSYKHG